MYKKANSEWISNLRGTEATKTRTPSRSTSKPKRTQNVAPYISPFIKESRRKAMERSKQSSRRKKWQPQPWNDEFAKDKHDYFDPKTQKERIFKLQPRDFPVRSKSPGPATNDDSTYTDMEYHKPDRKLTTKTTSDLPQHSPQKRYGLDLRNAPPKETPVTAEDDSDNPLEAERERSLPTRQQMQTRIQTHSSPAASPAYRGLQQTSHVAHSPPQTQRSPSPAAARTPPVVDTGVRAQGHSPPARRRPSPFPQHMSPTASWQQRQDSSQHAQTTRDAGCPSSPTHSPFRHDKSPRRRRSGQGSPYVPERVGREGEGPLRVTTRATSPFNERVIQQILGGGGEARDMDGDTDREALSPDHGRAAASRPSGCGWSETGGAGGGDSLVRVLEAHARAQEVTSQAHAHALGNMSKMMATLGKVILARDKQKHKQRPRPSPWTSAAMSWYMSQQSAAQVCEPAPPVPWTAPPAHTQSLYAPPPSQAPATAEIHTASRTPDAAQTQAEVAPCRRQQADARAISRAPPRQESVGERRTCPPEAKQRGPPSKYKVIDHVLAKLQDMEQQEKLILSELSVTRPPFAERTRGALSGENSQEEKKNPAAQPLVKSPSYAFGSDTDRQQEHQHLFLTRGSSGRSTGSLTGTAVPVCVPHDLHDTTDVFQALQLQNRDPYVAKGVTWQRDAAREQGLTLIRPDGVIRSEIEEYKRELRRCKLLRESTFRANKVTLTETCDRLTDALMEDILTESAEELEGIFSELADKFIDNV